MQMENRISVRRGQTPWWAGRHAWVPWRLLWGWGGAKSATHAQAIVSTGASLKRNLGLAVVIECVICTVVTAPHGAEGVFFCSVPVFAGNPMSRVGCGEVVQFARTHGCNAKSVDMSHCDLDDLAATEELSRLVKNSGTWSVHSITRHFISLFIGSLFMGTKILPQHSRNLLFGSGVDRPHS